MYCNLLQSSHFADTSIAAKLGDKLVGFISGYLIPDRPDTLFIWQVAVDESARGQGLAAHMISGILSRPENSHVHFIETTITPDNDASWALFRSFARKHNATLNDSEHFTQQLHFQDLHKTEHLVRIGPFNLTA